jgi:hypothetical protein
MDTNLIFYESRIRPKLIFLAYVFEIATPHALFGLKEKVKGKKMEGKNVNGMKVSRK